MRQRGNWWRLRERFQLSSPRESGEKKGTQTKFGGEEGQPDSSTMNRLPLSYPTASRRATFLSPLSRGEDVELYSANGS